MVGMKKTMGEWKAGNLHSGSKHGPVVKSQKQAIAIGLSEQRKEGKHVAEKNHHEKTAPGKMGAVHDHHEEQTHKVHGSERKNDGAGRQGHDMELRSRTEHRAPTHPEGSHVPLNPSPGPMGHPGLVLGLDHDGGKLIGGDYSQSAHEPAKLKMSEGQGFTAGHPGMHVAMGTKPSGYGHQAHQRSGNLRLSGHPNSHQLGKRK
jgi:hypothetical protein